MAEDEFSRFIDVLSEPGSTGLDAAGKQRFLAQLRESRITHFSLVFKEDLIAPERRLPWRAQLAMSRLKKDLSHVPLFHDLDQAGLRRLRQQVLHDVLRPIARADLLAAILMNSDLAASREVPPEEIEAELAHFTPDPLLLQTARRALEVHLAEAEPEACARQRRALLALVLRPGADGQAGVAELIRELFERGYVTLEGLPPAIKAAVLLERATDKYLARRDAFLRQLEAAAAPEPYRTLATTLVRLVPELLRRDLPGEVIGIVTMVSTHAALGGARGTAAEQALGRLSAGEGAQALKRKFTEGRKEDRLALGPVYLALGERMRPQLVQILEQSRDAWVRKHASEVLLRMGPEGVEAVLAELGGGRLEPGAVAELLMVFGELRCDAAAVREALREHARHPSPRVREEAAWALCRIVGAAEERLFLDLLGDPELEVRKRALRCLRAARCPGALPHVVALLSRVEQEPRLEPLESQLYASLPELAEAAAAPDAEVEGFLLDRIRNTGSHGLLAALRRPRRPLAPDAFFAVCDALGAIGTAPSLEALLELSRHVREPGHQRLARAIERIEARAA
jgi:hypothetical protein